MVKTIRQMTAGLGLMVMLVTGAGSVAMAQTRVDRVAARASETWTKYVTRGELVRVVVEGDGDTDLDLYVYQDGQLVAYDDDATDDCVAIFRATHSGLIQIRVVNRGTVWNQYVLHID